MKMWTLWCGMCVLLLSVLSVQSGLGLNSSNNCASPLGLENLRIRDSQLTAQSHYESLSIGGGKSVDTEPKCARLNKNNCAWCAPHGNGQYLQVDLRGDFTITGIATQGFEALSDYYVRRYKVSHRRTGHTWSTFQDVMIGNHDGRSVVRHNFSSPVYARYIRVYPMAYRYRICMRMELYGCSNSSSALSTAPAPSTQSAANSTTPENVPPTTTTTASTSTEKLLINHSTIAPSALRTTPSSTTLRVANDETPENVSPTTRTTAASSTENQLIIHSATASSALSTTPSRTTLSGANNIPEIVPPTTRTTAASSTEKPMISHSASDQLVESCTVLITTPTTNETLPSERHRLQNGNIAAVEMARGDSKKLIIAVVVVGVAVVIIAICLLVWLNRRRKRKCVYLHPGDEIDAQLL